MGKCIIVDNLEDGFYRVDILKNIESALRRKKRAKELIEKLEQAIVEKTALLDEANIEKQVFINEINTLIDQLTLGYDEELILEISEATSALVKFNVPIRVLESEIAIAELQIVNYNKQISAVEGIEVPETRSLWCADLTDDLIVGNEYDTMEIDREVTTILILPSGEPNNTGKLQPVLSSGSMMVVHNIVVMPAYQKWYSQYKQGIIASISHGSNTCTVHLSTNPSSIFNIGISKEEVLEEVPFNYMTCDHAAFEEGDRVIVYFERDEVIKNTFGYPFEPKGIGTPVVIGFLTKPQDCELNRFMYVAKLDNIEPHLELKAHEEPTLQPNKPVFEDAKRVNKPAWGSMDWRGVRNGIPTLISWKGPVSRHPFQVGPHAGEVNPTIFEESAIYENLREVLPLRVGYKTVGAGYNNTDLIVFYLKQTSEFPRTHELSVQVFDSDLLMTTNKVVLTEVAILLQLVAVSGNGTLATFIYNRVGETYEPPALADPNNPNAGRVVDAYKTRVVDLNVLDNFSLIEITQQVRLYTNTVGPFYRNEYQLRMPMVAPMVMAVDYKDNVKVDLTWLQTGNDTSLTFFAPAALFNQEGVHAVTHTFTSWFYTKQYMEEYHDRLLTYIGSSVWRDVVTLEFRGLDLRMGTIVVEELHITSALLPENGLEVFTDRATYITQDNNEKLIDAPVFTNYQTIQESLPEFNRRPLTLNNNLGLHNTNIRNSMVVDRYGNVCLVMQQSQNEGNMYFYTADQAQIENIVIKDNDFFTYDDLDTTATVFSTVIMGVV